MENLDNARRERLKAFYPAAIAGIRNATWRYRLFDINLLINRTLVYGALTATVVGIYALVVGYLGLLFEEETGNLAIALLVTGLIAVLLQPLRRRLQQGVNRLMYGERDDPYAVLARLGKRLEATLAPEAVLPTIVDTVAQALKLPYVAITMKQGSEFVLAAVHGSPAGDPLTLPLIYQGVTIGQLLVVPRAAGEPFSPADWRLLEGIARQAGVAAQGVCLTADLQRSRELLVAAREEERRRLQRDLHDGLGPGLASFTLKLDAAHNLLTHNPSAASALLLELRAQTQAIIVDIRRLVYDLRPLALDQLGLVSAIREYAASYDNLKDLRISVEVAENLPPLPAAVEAVAYRITQEALTNVARHAQACTCTIGLRLDDTLHLEICDDGIGLPPEVRAGVGINSMQERAAELGGTCVVEPLPTGGTCVLARLPLRSPAFPFMGWQEGKSDSFEELK
jgi:signal transduction histidine kinase